ncbi:MAG TPA: hypothetical protein VLI05_06830 [Candidatus Saccharimonadia bacterium]|nr:hypothetical protein [Candidatus Saccharimonadia bacterium]
MMQSSPLTPSAQRLAAQLEAATALQPESGQTFHVASIGDTFYLAYEQLRNAAEYREHHLLLRSAIERYLKRYVDLRRYRPIGPELVTELTQAGYLANDSVPMAKVGQIDALLLPYAALIEQAPQLGRGPRQLVVDWIYQIASAQIGELLLPNRRLAVFMAFAYEHYLAAVDRAAGAEPGETDQAYQVALYCAVQSSIFKSDLATTRYYCLAASLPTLSEQSFGHFIQVNQLIDDLQQAPRTHRLARLINRYGSPMRILRELVAGEGTAALPPLNDRAEVVSRIKRLCQQQYTLMHKRLGARIIKTILFIFITKVLLGVALEVPYDLLAAGAIAWFPLVLNIMFPVVYMVLLSARISTPDRHNTELIASFVERILYVSEQPVQYRLKQRVASATQRSIFNAVYAVGFLVSFGLLLWALYQLHFNVVNGLIFFLFLSAVSFLGFRLRQSTRELAMLDLRQGFFQTLADFLSTPFVRVGYWLSDHYARLNLVTRILDIAIEMPLKTTLRLVQQWIGFMRDKQEEL